MNPGKHQALEKLWQSRLREAQAALESARNQLRQIEKERASGTFESPDGEFAYRQALRTETAALIEYSRVLRINSDLILRGKIPDDQDSD